MANLPVTYDQYLFLSKTDLDPDTDLLPYTQQGSPDVGGNTYNLGSPTTGFTIGYSKSTSNNGMIAVWRYFVTIDTSAINRTPVTAVFNVFATFDGADIICLKSKKVSPTALEETDWDGHDETNPIPYTNSITPDDGGMGTWNSLTFNLDGKNAMADNDYLEMVCVESDADYAQVEPAYGTVKSSFYAHGDGGAFEPYLTYEMGETRTISSGKVNINSGKVTIK